LRHYQTTVRCAWGAQTLLGEGPVWDPRSQTLHFVNIKANDLLSFREKGVVASVQYLGDCPRCFSRILHASYVPPHGACCLPNIAGIPRVLTPIEVGRPGNRTNDGKIDPLGRVWIGTMDDTEKAVTGALYRVDHDTAVTRVLDDIGVSNGLDWSPDGTVLYYTDSKRRVIWRLPFDMEAGTVGRPEVFATVPRSTAVPTA